MLGHPRSFRGGTSPASGRSPRRASGTSLLTLAGDPAWLEPDYDSYRSLPALCTHSGHPNAVLGLGDTRGEYLGGLIESAEKLPAKKLLDPRTRKLKVSGDASVSYPNAIQTAQPNDVTTGKTTLAWNLTFKRAGR